MKRKAIIYQEDCMPISCPYVVDIYIWDIYKNKFIYKGFHKYFRTIEKALCFANKYTDIIEREGIII